MFSDTVGTLLPNIWGSHGPRDGWVGGRGWTWVEAIRPVFNRPSMSFRCLQMLTTRGSDSDVQYMLNNFEWVILPVLNVDGYEYTHTNVSYASQFLLFPFLVLVRARLVLAPVVTSFFQFSWSFPFCRSSLLLSSFSFSCSCSSTFLFFFSCLFVSCRCFPAIALVCVPPQTAPSFFSLVFPSKRRLHFTHQRL